MKPLSQSMRVLFNFAAAFAAVLAAAPAYAQVYKWVDEKGVTNYSSEAPASHKAIKKIDVVADRISVIPPDESLKRAIASAADPALTARIDRLERQLQAERQAREYAAAEAQASTVAYQQCLADRRVDCDGYPGYYPYARVIVAAPFRRRPFFPIVPATGVTAGNVTPAIRAGGGNVNATPGMTATFRPASRAATGRGIF